MAKPCEVLESIKKMGCEKATEPFKVSQQYKSSWQDDDEPCETEPAKMAADGAKKLRAKGPKKSKSKKKPKNKSVPPASPSQKRQYGDYKPEAYKKVRAEYIDQKRSEGASYAIANGAWHLSTEKAKLLSALPVGELVRRRFLPKGAKENPWAA